MGLFFIAIALLASSDLARGAAQTSTMLVVTVQGDGRVTSSPIGISCPPECEAPLKTATLTARPRAGASFAGWSGACEGTATTCTVTIDAERSATVSAQFTDRKPPLPGGGAGGGGASPPPAPQRGSTQAALQEIDEILKGLELATVAFNTPDGLGLDESATIELLLSTQASIEELKQDVSAAGRRLGARIRISPQMEARLTGQGFEIEAITPEVQSVSSSEITSWKWDVKPTQSGTLRLHLTLTAILDVRGSPSKRTVRTFERTLAIKVSLSDRAATFLQNNWQWLWTAILVPGGLWYLNRRKRSTPSGAAS